MKEHTDVIALDASGEVYNIEALIKEIKAGTRLAQDAAKLIIGTAFEIALRNSEQTHSKRYEEAQAYFDDFMEKYGKWMVTDEDRENG
tara:strand:- start:4165 stop:4428 length:264 start_codon:yes stop_codon:yes gene_type:complete